MADTGAPRGRRTGTANITCSETCGCDVPCPGGAACRCATSVEVTHTTCSCGKHCSCADCACGAVPADAAVGKEGCVCGDNCNCTLCHT